MIDNEVRALLKNNMESNTLISNVDALSLAEYEDVEFLQHIGAEICCSTYGNIVSFSKKIFIPLTKLCRDSCHYCTFAQTPKNVESPYMPLEDVLKLARKGAASGCKEALFTLGEKPELRYSAARKSLADMGFTSTLDYVYFVAKTVFEETGLLPHLNVGCMSEEEMLKLREVSASMGLMLESSSERLCAKGMPHYGSPDKQPAVRLETIEVAGKLSVPFTTGILIGIGETRRERIQDLLKIRELHQQYGHIQECIIQNFRAKKGTKMQYSIEPSMRDLQWTIAVARIILDRDISIQVPPNLSPGGLESLVDSGINDWGGVSPLTPDHVNPEAPWPHLEDLRVQSYNAGKYLQERLTIYPHYLNNEDKWLSSLLKKTIFEKSDTQGLARVEGWFPGSNVDFPENDLQRVISKKSVPVSENIKNIVEKCFQREVLSENDIVALFESRNDDFSYVCQAADKMRKEIVGDTVTYVVNRNINYTNICNFKCSFCAFSKGKVSEGLRESPYNMKVDEIVSRARDAWERGATEICLQGGIHPSFTGDHYLTICNKIKQDNPEIHIHAFSPLEIWHGAETNNVTVKEFLQQLKNLGLGSLPGTAAEILDDKIRAKICSDKLNTEQWLSVIKEAHLLGIRTTSTIMFGHVETYNSWAKHLMQLLELQKLTGGFTEFVPLPFVAEESPMYKRSYCHKGPTFRESILMHAVSRLVFNDYFPNIQASWVKLGEKGLSACLQAGANDAGGVLMNESITRAAGAKYGQLFSEQRMRKTISSSHRTPQQRDTFYNEISQQVTLVNLQEE